LEVCIEMHLFGCSAAEDERNLYENVKP